MQLSNCSDTTLPFPVEKKDKIKRAFIPQPLAEGGLNFINFATMVKSLRLAWISRLLGDTDDSWKVIPNSYLSEYGSLQFLRKYINNAESINIGLPNFCRELLQYFQELKKQDQYISLRRALTVEQQGHNHWKLSRFLEILVQTENSLCTRCPKCEWKFFNNWRIPISYWWNDTYLLLAFVYGGTTQHQSRLSNVYYGLLHIYFSALQISLTLLWYTFFKNKSTFIIFIIYLVPLTDRNFQIS